MLNDKTILITGGTGSFGKQFVSMTLRDYKPKKIIVYSRDEMKQYEMAKAMPSDRVRYFIGDVRDKERLWRACDKVDYIIHAAALKIVPTAEYNPFEYIKTNINGAMNIIDVAIDRQIERVIALSTDKACNPVNLYGATKLCGDKLFIAGNSYSGIHETRFAIVRYGNVMGSRGSVIPFFMEQAKEGLITITDVRMTRFWITLQACVELVYKAMAETVGGEIFVPKIPSMKVVDLARAISDKAQLKITGIRPGEKLHETLISEDDARYTYDFDDHYRIMPALYANAELHKKNQQGLREVPEGFRYTSEENDRWLTVDQMRELLRQPLGA